MNVVAIIVSVGCLIIAGSLLMGLKKLYNDCRQLVEQKNSLKEQLDKTLKAKKASEIKLGYITEQFAPFLENWKYDAANFRFLGKPIDGVQFEEDEIIFIEIKSGQSSLSQKQRHIKELVKQGKVSFRVFRVDENGSGHK